MNIGIVTTWHERGAGYVSKQYADVLKRENSVFIYARGGDTFGYTLKKDRWNDEAVTWDKGIVDKRPTSLNLKQFESWLKRSNIEIVFFNEQKNYEAVLLCHKFGLTIGAYIDYYKENTIEFFEIYDFLICNTLKHLSAFDWHSGAEYLAWGTNVDVFTPKIQNELNGDGVVFFHSAGQNPKRKGTDLLLKAFSQIKNKLSSKIIIHTQIDLGVFFPKLKWIISDLINKGHLEVIHKTVQAPGLYYLGDVYVYPSRLDGIGLTVAEALSCGLPVICSDCGPMNEFVKDPKRLVEIDKYVSRSDGYYWPQSICDIEDLKFKLEYFIETPEILSKLKVESRKYAVSELDWNKNATNINAIFKKYLNSAIQKKNQFLLQSIAKYENKRVRKIDLLAQKIPYSKQFEIFIKTRISTNAKV